MRKRMNDYDRRWDNFNRRWVYKHREVMEQHIGRSLRPDEHVHHINENHTDNRIENLQIVSPAEHIRLHKPAKHLNVRLCEIDGCENKHHAKGLCKKHQMRQLRANGVCM